MLVRFAPFTVHSYLVFLSSWNTQILCAALPNHFILLHDGCNKNKKRIHCFNCFFLLSVKRVSLRFVRFASSHIAINHLSFYCWWFFWFLRQPFALDCYYIFVQERKVYSNMKNNFGEIEAFDIGKFKYKMGLNSIHEIDETMNIYLPVFQFMNRKS